MKPIALLVLLTAAAAAQDPATPATVAGNVRPVDGVVAVVGEKPILWSEVLETIGRERANGANIPTDSAGAVEYARTILTALIDEEVLLQRAAGDTSIRVADADLNETVEQQVSQIRTQFPSEQEFLRQLRLAGFGTLEEYRTFISDQARRAELQRRLVQKYQAEGRMIRVAVSDRDVTEAYERARASPNFPRRPPAVTFRQLVIPTAASPEALAEAKRKADSLVAELRRGADFAQIARRESMDSGSAQQGGDLGWNRRGELVPAFEQTMFRLPPGQVSQPVLTQYGYHIIKVDRARPAEVKASHILIKPSYAGEDTLKARARADSALALWRAGTPFDSLVRRFHDSDEEQGSIEPFPKEQLPPSYREAIGDQPRGSFVGPFGIEDRGRGVPKYVVLQVTEVIEAGEFTVDEVRDRLRQQLQQERSFRRLLDNLKSQTYVRTFPVEPYLQRG
jgi:parvulin-like peptidyl-prolyl isomerase